MFHFDGVTIRAVEEGDLDRMRALRNDPTTWTMLTDVGMIDADSQRRWFERVRAASDRRYYVVCDDGHDFIGIVRTDEIDRVNRSIRVGADIVRESRGQGYGRKVYRLLKKYCFDYLNVHRVWLAVLDTNEAGRRLYESEGFEVEGRYREAVFRDGKYHDYILMSILEQRYRGGLG
jgi:diamine N-acetyltransferase